MNKGNILFVVVLLICIAVLTSIGLWIALPFHTEETKKIWLPQKYLIANKATGFYVTVGVPIRPNATLMDFDQMLANSHENKFSNDTFDIYILQNSTVLYYWDYQGLSLTSKNNYGAGQNGAHDTAVTAMTDDSHIVIVYSANTWAGAALIFFVAFGIICGVVFGVIAKENI